jgi:hypothetical protein
MAHQSEPLIPSLAEIDLRIDDNKAERSMLVILRRLAVKAEDAMTKRSPKGAPATAETPSPSSS